MIANPTKTRFGVRQQGGVPDKKRESGVPPKAGNAEYKHGENLKSPQHHEPDKK